MTRLKNWFDERVKQYVRNLNNKEKEEYEKKIMIRAKLYANMIRDQKGVVKVSINPEYIHYSDGYKTATIFIIYDLDIDWLNFEENMINLITDNFVDESFDHILITARKKENN